MFAKSLESVANLSQIGRSEEAMLMFESMIKEFGWYGEEESERLRIVRQRLPGMNDMMIWARQDMENEIHNAEQDYQDLLPNFRVGVTVDQLQPIYDEMRNITDGHTTMLPELERENQNLRRLEFERAFSDWENLPPPEERDEQPYD